MKKRNFKKIKRTKQNEHIKRKKNNNKNPNKTHQLWLMNFYIQNEKKNFNNRDNDSNQCHNFLFIRFLNGLLFQSIYTWRKKKKINQNKIAEYHHLIEGGSIYASIGYNRFAHSISILLRKWKHFLQSKWFWKWKICFSSLFCKKKTFFIIVLYIYQLFQKDRK